MVSQDYRNRSKTFSEMIENPHGMKSYFSFLALALPLPSLIKRRTILTSKDLKYRFN